MPSHQEISPFSHKLTLWLIRQWWRGKQLMGTPPSSFWQAFQHLRGDEAGLRFDLWMDLLNQLAGRKLHILCPCREALSSDEDHLLATLRAWQADDDCAGRRLLHGVVNMATQNETLIWASQECAASLLLNDINLSIRHQTTQTHPMTPRQSRLRTAL